MTLAHNGAEANDQLTRLRAPRALPRRTGRPMTLAPLLSASPVIQAHAAFAFAAIALGAVQLLSPKGTLPHRATGWTWTLLMIGVAGTSLFIHTIRTWGP